MSGRGIGSVARSAGGACEYVVCQHGRLDGLFPVRTARAARYGANRAGEVVSGIANTVGVPSPGVVRAGWTGGARCGARG